MQTVTGFWHLSINLLIFALTRIGILKGFYKGFLVKDFYISGIGFIRPKYLLSIYEIKDLDIIQDPTRYFNIIAISKLNQKYPLKRMPNRIPANEELQRIRKYINQYPSI